MSDGVVDKYGAILEDAARFRKPKPSDPHDAVRERIARLEKKRRYMDDFNDMVHALKDVVLEHRKQLLLERVPVSEHFIYLQAEEWPEQFRRRHEFDKLFGVEIRWTKDGKPHDRFTEAYHGDFSDIAEAGDWRNYIAMPVRGVWFSFNETQRNLLCENAYQIMLEVERGTKETG